MLIQSPRMYAKQFLPSGWDAYLYFMLATMRGGGNIIHDDVSDAKYAPAAAITRNTNRTINANTAATSVTNTFLTIASTSDILDVWVAAPSSKAQSQSQIGSNTTQGWINRLNSGVTAGSSFADSGTATQSVGNTPSSPAWSANDKIVSALAVDVSDTTTGLIDYCYNITTGALIYEVDAAHAANAACTPAQTLLHKNLASLYFHGTFVFPSNGLPTTWKTDILALAHAVIALKS